MRRSASGGKQTVGGPERGGVSVLFVVSVVAVVFAFAIFVTIAADAFGEDDPPASPGGETPTEQPSSAPPTSEPSAAQPSTQPTAPPTVDPATGAIIVACGDILAPLDKQHRLERNCVPPDLQAVPAQFSSGTQRLRAEARDALVEMFAAAQQAGFTLYTNSAYRDFATQSATYDYWVNQFGKEYADRTSARPGHSEHQMGTAADVGWSGCELECTIGSPEAAWIAENSYKFGFIVSYPEGKEQITGYAYEPWHVRYLGKDKALEVKNSGLTLHEFLLK